MPIAIDDAQTKELIQSRNLVALAEIVRESPADAITELLEALPAEEAAVVFRLLDKSTAIDVFDTLDPAAQADLVAELGHAPLAEVFAALEPDEQARLLDELPAKVTKRLLASYDRRQLEPVMTLLGYPQHTVGRQMSPNRVHLSPDDTAESALDRLRAFDGDLEAVATLPVIAADRVLVGVVDPLDLLRCDPKTRILDLTDTSIDPARTDDNVEKLARRILDRGHLALPVVDRENRLVGIFPIADAAQVDKDAVAEDQARAGGSEPLRRAYLLTPVRSITKSRIVWLLVLAISAVLTVQVLEMFEATLAQQVTLALFIPLLTGIGGNTGSQAATTITRALALGHVSVRDFARVAFKEMRTGLLLGLILATLAFSIASPFYGLPIGTVIAVTIILNCPVAATVGGVIPLAAKACRVDPAVVSTPFISTFVDASGLLLYFTVAISILGLNV